MSMPIIVPSNTTRCQSVTDIFESVALEQTALSHILNAEGEKIQAVLKIANVTASELLCVNQSVQDTINAITRLEMILQMKLEVFKHCVCDDCCDDDCDSCGDN